MSAFPPSCNPVHARNVAKLLKKSPNSTTGGDHQEKEKADRAQNCCTIQQGLTAPTINAVGGGSLTGQNLLLRSLMSGQKQQNDGSGALMAANSLPAILKQSTGHLLTELHKYCQQ